MRVLIHFLASEPEFEQGSVQFPESVMVLVQFLESELVLEQTSTHFRELEQESAQRLELVPVLVRFRASALDW